MKNLVKCSLSAVAADEEPVVRTERDNLETHLKELNCFHSIGKGQKYLHKNNACILKP
jgi:hypothetical protein